MNERVLWRKLWPVTCDEVAFDKVVRFDFFEEMWNKKFPKNIRDFCSELVMMDSTRILIFFFLCFLLNQNCVQSNEQIASKDFPENVLEKSTKTPNTSISQPIGKEDQNNE